MNKMIKLILIIAGAIFLMYGGYELITPETSIDLGITEIETQNNNNAYIAIGVGVVILLTSLLVKNK